MLPIKCAYNSRGYKIIRSALMNCQAYSVSGIKQKCRSIRGGEKGKTKVNVFPRSLTPPGLITLHCAGNGDRKTNVVSTVIREYWLLKWPI